VPHLNFRIATIARKAGGRFLSSRERWESGKMRLAARRCNQAHWQSQLHVGANSESDRLTAINGLPKNEQAKPATQGAIIT
jgi:hypothetical protein